MERDSPQLRDLRPVIIHAQLMGTDQLPLAKALGFTPSFFVAHVYHWGDIHLKNFGPDRPLPSLPPAPRWPLASPSPSTRTRLLFRPTCWKPCGAPSTG